VPCRRAQVPGQPGAQLLGRLFFRSKLATSTAACAASADSVCAEPCRRPGWSRQRRWWEGGPGGKRWTRGRPRSDKDGTVGRRTCTRRDGWGILRFLLLFSPRWAFFLPPGPAHRGPDYRSHGGRRTLQQSHRDLDVDTLVAASAMVVIAVPVRVLWLFTVYAGSEGF